MSMIIQMKKVMVMMMVLMMGAIMMTSMKIHTSLMLLLKESNMTFQVLQMETLKQLDLQELPNQKGHISIKNQTLPNISINQMIFTFLLRLQVHYKYKMSYKGKKARKPNCSWAFAQKKVYWIKWKNRIKIKVKKISFINFSN